jgi:hypothetical protein
MTRIVTYSHRRKRPPRKQQAVPLTGPAVVATRTRLPKATPTAVTAAPPANDDRKPVHAASSSEKPAIVTAGKPSKRTEPVSVSASPAPDERSAAAPSAIVTTASRKHRIKDGPTLPMELPLSRKPVEREGDGYKRLKAAMTRRLRSETN